MSDNNETGGVIGDGAITIPIEKGTHDMPVELGTTISELLLTESAGNIQANNRDGRNVGTMALGTLQAGMSKQFNELGPVESRSVSGVMATPIASPTTQAAAV